MAKIKLLFEFFVRAVLFYYRACYVLVEVSDDVLLRILRIRKNLRPKLPHFLLLVMDPDRVEERIGDLEEKRFRIAQEYSPGYANLWYFWTGFWVFVAAVFAKLPGKFLLDALKNRVSKD